MSMRSGPASVEESSELAALARENERLRAALGAAENERAAIRCFLDTPAIAITQMRRDGTIALINQAGARNLGGTPAQLEGQNIYRLIPELAEQTRRRIEQTLETGEPLFVETMVKLPVGERWFHSTYYAVLGPDQQRDSVQLVSQDITELKRIEQVLQATEGRLSSVLEHAPHLVVVLDHDGVIRYINRVPQGYELEQVLDSKATANLPAIYAEPFSNALRDVLQTGRPQLLEIDDLFGRRWEIQLAPIVRDGVVHQALAFVLDVSERRQARERERKLEAQVQHAQKLESLGVLAGGIAHDFNNLLVGILGNAQLARQVTARAALDEHLSGIIQAAQRAAELARQMLAYAGRGQLALAPVDLTSLTTEIIALLRASVSKRARLSSDCPAGLPCVMADVTQLRQVVMNLVTNASDALGGGDGEIVVRCGVIDCDADYLARSYLNESLPAGLYAYVEVQDNGCGMDAETRRRMFDPFFTSKRLGSGLGLAAVLGIVRRHRGTIYVDSELSRGTTIRVLLPVAHAVALGSTDAAPGRILSGHTILVVDDDPMVRSVAQRVLELAGCRVVPASDGLEALERYDANPAAIDAVLLDLSMPRMDGRQTLVELRARSASLPVVLMSGFATYDAEPQADDAATCFVPKPFDTDSLVGALQRALGREQDEL